MIIRTVTMLNSNRDTKVIQMSETMPATWEIITTTEIPDLTSMWGVRNTIRRKEFKDFWEASKSFARRVKSNKRCGWIMKK